MITSDEAYEAWNQHLDRVGIITRNEFGIAQKFKEKDIVSYLEGFEEFCREEL